MNMQYGRFENTGIVPVDEAPTIRAPTWARVWHKLRTPLSLRHELGGIGFAMGDISKALAYNLHYELSGGGCISAAIPGKKFYIAYRRLEWAVGFSPVFRREKLQGVSHNAWVRRTPGYVGALSGGTDDYHISMNFSPEAHWCGFSLPMSWRIRGVLATCPRYEDAINYFVGQENKVMVSAYVVIVGKKKAAWLDVAETSSYIDGVEFPTPLVVGNDYEEEEMPDTITRRNSTKEYQAPAGAWVLDEYKCRL